MANLSRFKSCTPASALYISILRLKLSICILGTVFLEGEGEKETEEEEELLPEHTLVSNMSYIFLVFSERTSKSSEVL
jgi:hypothetical protein